MLRPDHDNGTTCDLCRMYPRKGRGSYTRGTPARHISYLLTTLQSILYTANVNNYAVSTCKHTILYEHGLALSCVLLPLILTTLTFMLLLFVLTHTRTHTFSSNPSNLLLALFNYGKKSLYYTTISSFIRLMPHNMRAFIYSISLA